jgi:hypothetical protein
VISFVRFSIAQAAPAVLCPHFQKSCLIKMNLRVDCDLSGMGEYRKNGSAD